MKTLELTEFPLDGLSLIEASAGTGKTYALANLYLRYLLESRFSVEQILVVTFTEAATQELKDRIRLRIKDLRKVFAGEATSDPILLHLVKSSTKPDEDQLILRLAERQIDQAQIHTIHGFCQQVLKRYALDSNVPLKQNLLEDQSLLNQQVVEDFWRSDVLALDPEALSFIVQTWPEPGNLLQALSPLLNRPPEALIPAPEGEGLAYWQNQFAVYREWFVSLKMATLDMIDDVYQLLIETPLKNNKTKLDWLNKMKAWAQADKLDFKLPMTSKESLFERFTQSRVNLETPKNKPSPGHPYFDFLETHLASTLPDIYPLFLSQSYPAVRKGIEQAKQQEHVFSFDDLISRVANALKPVSNHQAAQVDTAQAANYLAAMISAPYQVALIDEFQDTDPSQYLIFDRLFGTQSVKTQPRLVLIGDPKQAIYGFRGGDIQTYLKAKRDIARHPQGYLFTMDTNWRSSKALVGAVNAIFSYPDNAFMAEDIPFQAVNAVQKAPAYLPSQALQVAQLETYKGITKAEIETSLASYCVAQIKHVIEQSVSSSNSNASGFKYSDIAVLVRSGKEGALMKAALAEQGLTATLDSQDSIYQSAEAQALYFLLAAVADPKDERALRRCLAEPFFGIDDQQIREFNEQSRIFTDYLRQFERLHLLWQRAGVLAMIRESLRCLGVFDYWHSQLSCLNQTEKSRFWERSLTNWNQLAEILQKQSRIHKGHFALFRWFKDSLAASLAGNTKGNDDTKLRLESDAQLIRIVTIHKSKGLEYPFVFIPFMFSCRGAMEAWFYDAQGKLTLDLSGAEASLVAAEQERLAEDIRLLYVALTRAKYQCYIGTTAYQSRVQLSLGLPQTAWAYLVFQGNVPDKIDDDSYALNLNKLEQAYPDLIKVTGFTVEEASLAQGELFEEAPDISVEQAVTVLSTNLLKRAIYDDWKVHSFTGLMNESHHRSQGPNASSLSVQHTLARPMAREPNLAALSIFDFPKGSQAGIFLHTLFEHINFEEGELLADSQQQYGGIRQFIHTKLKFAKLVEDDALDVWADYLSTWLKSVLQSPLASGISLSCLNTQQYFSEMQFYFSVENMHSAGFNALLKEYLGTRADIDFSRFKGHLKGAIDLVFEAQGKFYILDYKSNYLGDQIQDYQAEALALAMQDHRYDVQYLIYTLALHRFLKQRLKNRYDYSQHFGGVIYLFLRGLNIEHDASQRSDSGVHFTCPPTALIHALDELVGQ
ncbi:MAG: exodeoxyribonuclease V subunit beta [Oleiphilus sp.]